MKKKKKSAKNSLLLDDIVKRFGTQIHLVSVPVYMTHQEATSYLGEPCDEYERLCPCCEGWDSWQRTSIVNVLLDRDDVLKLLK